jgi:hypothetical protein
MPRSTYRLIALPTKHLKKAGLAGFLFFLIKGLVWLWVLWQAMG